MIFEGAHTKLEGVTITTRQQAGDQRGSFSRLFCADQLGALGWQGAVVQTNLSRNMEAGTLRGLHLQFAPHAEMKFVQVIEGRVLDVAVDLRAGSKTYGQHIAVELSAENQQGLLIPKGCAHGFQLLSEKATLIYHHSAAYQPDAEGGVRFDDPELNIAWPLPARNLSARDLSLPSLARFGGGVRI
ncbi:dTDP-4-dehydrorhamnose 3,5-epimerase [Maritalea mediterranea]|uniref:dTDP-4-dehydrorhamnose 3,5-epimerase n=1 Tax=Maritalea mediterranea TaxID=2909667 RepID=A0ABS9E4A0_9HYPH|nr:dTDP-4-dehydrorhamnose 3,5-epimerase [Maritalea mediterranea]MCF4097692.1 dTDP-4-dehydrorhamnose 3,5-epimerase [Maritalea mediterranea]